MPSSKVVVEWEVRSDGIYEATRPVGGEWRAAEEACARATPVAGYPDRRWVPPKMEMEKAVALHHDWMNEILYQGPPDPYADPPEVVTLQKVVAVRRFPPGVHDDDYIILGSAPIDG